MIVRELRRGRPFAARCRAHLLRWTWHASRQLSTITRVRRSENEGEFKERKLKREILHSLLTLRLLFVRRRPRVIHGCSIVAAGLQAAEAGSGKPEAGRSQKRSRSYLINARSRMRAQASCTMPRKFSTCRSQRVTTRRELWSQAKSRSIFQRRFARRSGRPSCVRRAAAAIRARSSRCRTASSAGRRAHRCRSRGRRSGAHGRSGRKRASRVAGTRCGSYGEALATCTAIGRPWRSQIAMILVPLPRRVGPIAAPLFSPRRRSRRRRLHSDRSCRGRGGPRRGVAAADRGGPSAARAGSDDGRFGTADSATAGRATARRCAGPTARRSCTARGSVHGRPRPSGRRRGRNVGSSTAHWASVRSMPSSTTARGPL